MKWRDQDRKKVGGRRGGGGRIKNEEEEFSTRVLGFPAADVLFFLRHMGGEMHFSPVCSFGILRSAGVSHLSDSGAQMLTSSSGRRGWR